MQKRTKEKLFSQGGEVNPSTSTTGFLSETQRIGKEGENPSEKEHKDFKCTVVGDCYMGKLKMGNK